MTRQSKIFRLFPIFFLLVPILLMNFNIPVAAGLEYPVHNIDTGLNYTTIQEAINAADTLNGHTILVDAGTYAENIVINKELNLIGEGPEVTIITATTLSTNAINVTSNNVNISGFKITNATQSYPTGCGVYFNSVNNVSFSNNHITNNTYGISMVSSDNCTLSNNLVYLNYFGVNLEIGNHNNTIIGNNASSNTVYGIVIWAGSDYNVVLNNVFLDNGRAITLGYSDFNVITYNNVLENSLGIEIQQISKNNTIFHNNIVNNGVQVSGGQLSDSINILDDSYPSGGNYWSNYSGVDLDQDGIGDTPHIINVNNTDNYPLMGMFSDFKVTSEYSVQTICNSSISDFQFDGAIRFNVAGESEIVGFCRICIPITLINGDYKVFVNGIEVPYDLLPFSNSIHSYLYFNYHHSIEEVIIVPEFSFTLLMISVAILVSTVALSFKQKLTKRSR